MSASEYFATLKSTITRKNVNELCESFQGKSRYLQTPLIHVMNLYRFGHSDMQLHLEMVRWLLHMGADPNCHNYGDQETIRPSVLSAAFQDMRNVERYDAPNYVYAKAVVKLLLLYSSGDCSCLMQLAWGENVDAQTFLENRRVCAKAVVTLLGIRRFRRSAVLNVNPYGIVKMIAASLWSTRWEDEWKSAWGASGSESDSDDVWVP